MLLRGVLAGVVVCLCCGCSAASTDGSGRADGDLAGPGAMNGSGGAGTGSDFGNTGSGGAMTGGGGTMLALDAGGDGCVEAIDIVFVMDVSLSMAGFFAKLEEEILVVDAALRMIDVAAEPHYGLAVFVDDALLVGDGAPFTDAALLRDEFVAWRAFTSLNSQVLNQAELNLDWTENSLDALYLAATGFQWRDQATTLRMIIHTTDDTFWDAGGTAAEDPLAALGNPRSMRGYAETIAAIRDAGIRVNHFAAHTRTFDGSGVDVSPGFFTPYAGAQTIPLSTGGVAWDIADVLQGRVSLAEDIQTSVRDTRCQEYPDVKPL